MGCASRPARSVDDGLLDVCVVGDISRLTVLRQLPNLYRGTHMNHPAVSMRSGSIIDADSDGATRIHLDGEPFGSLPLHVAVGHRMLAVAAPG